MAASWSRSCEPCTPAAVPLLCILTLLFWLALRWEPEWAFVAACLIFLLFVPAIFRYSRILWIHFDRWTEPED